jgi:hypothetical protein
LHQPHHLKFRLFDLLPEVEHLLYFDADTIFLRRWEVTALAQERLWCAVPDRPNYACVQNECRTFGLDPAEYFNSGLFLACREHHAELLHKAGYYTDHAHSVFHDQTWLNLARHRLRLPLRLLPREFNRLDFDALPPAESTVVGHFRRIDERPEAEMIAWFAKWRDASPALRLASRDELPPAAAPPTRRPAVSTPQTSWLRPIPAHGPAYGVAGHVVLPRATTGIIPGEAEHRAWLDQAVERAERSPRRSFSGRGIVIAGGGGKYFPCAYVLIRLLRHLGCRLPIELWHLGAAELSAEMRALVEPHAVATIDAHEVRHQFPVRRLHGWELKPYAIIHSSFEEVLLLDADNVPIADPTYLFDTPHYRVPGAAFWPDFGRLSADNPIWRVTGVAYRPEPEFESGQMLIDKIRCWRALQVTLHLNEHSDFYYRHLHGDKDTFHLAWRRLQQLYAMPQRGPGSLPGTILQYDFAGQPLFQHRNFAKWQLHGPNRHIVGFRHEKQCLAYLHELRQSGVACPPRAATATAHATRPAPPPVEAVLINWRRPQHLARILAALRAQTVPCRVTVVECAANSEWQLPTEVAAQADSLFHEHDDWGPFARFVPVLGFRAPWLLFLDDDFVPGPRALEHLLATAASLLGTPPGTLPRPGKRPLGALGERGRRLAHGGYTATEVPRSARPERVDALVRAHFLPAENLAHLLALRARHPQLFTPPVCDDDLLLALALREAHLPIYLTPEAADPATRLLAEELPEPHAMSARAGHLTRRDAFVRRWFPSRTIPSPYAHPADDPSETTAQEASA